MKEYHTQAAGIPEYINMLEDAQRAAIRINKKCPITDDSVLTIATAAMLETQQFPRTTEEYEDLPPEQKDWPTWKKMYKAAQAKERVRARASGGTNSFGGSNAGGANAATGNNTSDGAAGGADADEDNGAAFTVEDLEACFDNLASAAKAERSTLDELVKSNAALVRTNGELVAANNKLDQRVTQLNNTIANLKKNGDGGSSRNTRRRGQRGKPACAHCKDTDHPSDECLELPSNASKRPAGWKSKL
jgi:hypothetical protein